MSKMRTIAVVTGTRAEYGYLKPLMKRILNDKELKLIPIVTGMHFLKEFGESYKLIEKDFNDIIKIPMELKGDSLPDMAFYLSDGIKNFSEYFDANRPDLVIVLGDRSEPLAVALACLYLNIPLAHINCGDVSGKTIDESIRHSITKLAHVHLAFTQKNADRIEKMGEEKWRIHVMGSTTAEIILNENLIEKFELFKKYELDPNKKTYLVIHHPITTISDRGMSELIELISALDELTDQIIIIYPSIDAGAREFIKKLEEFSKNSNVKMFKNIPHIDYLSLMKAVDLMIGNSSSGIIEAPVLRVPVINIGNRQSGRERSDNIIDVEPKKNKILEKIQFALTDKDFLTKVENCTSIYGSADASQKMVEVIKKIEINEKLIQKQITY